MILSLSCKAQQIQEKKLIIGTWIPDGSPDSHSVFTLDGSLKKYSNNQLFKTYNWSISEDKSVDGALTHSFLKLIDVNSINTIYEYEINGLSDTKMLLVTTQPKISYLYFTKQ